VEAGKVKREKGNGREDRRIWTKEGQEEA